MHLINDILDLSKIESGTVTVEVEEIPFAGLRDNIDRNFRHVAEAKNLPFHVQFAESLPPFMDSDPKRLQQILKNLLSNAVKFTAHGHVEVRVGLATQGWTPDHPVLSKASQVVAFAVEDTGIGVAPEKQRLIFEAFQQADAGTSRKYGGTGLGLAISRELAVLLGGEIKLASVHGQGSTFTLYPAAPLFRPQRAHGPRRPPALRPRPRTHGPARRARRADRGRPQRHRGRAIRCCSSSRTIRTMPASCWAWRATRASRASSPPRAPWASPSPGSIHPAAISLDIFLPDMLGWTVLNQLKLDPATRHIPVQIVTLEEERQHGLAHGAFSYLVKAPTTEGLEAAFDRIKDFTAPRTKRLLVVEDNEIERQSIVELLGYRRHRDGDRRPPAARRWRRCSTSRSTAWCSTCVCPT